MNKLEIISPEFDGIRSSYYREAMEKFPNARNEEQAIALEALNPKNEENILEVGAGGGYFSLPIAESIYPGILTATDPSIDQLKVIEKHHISNIKISVGGADSLDSNLPENAFDAIFSCGSFHHVKDKTKAFFNFYKILKTNGRVIIVDVFSGSTLAKHFDLEVSKYCLTGHEVSFLSDDFADSLCYLTGFRPPELSKKVVRWKFACKSELSWFLYKIHAMTGTTPEKCGEKADEILGIDCIDGFYYLNWPLTILKTYKV